VVSFLLAFPPITTCVPLLPVCATCRAHLILLLQASPTSRHLIPLRSKYSPQHPVLKHPSSMFHNFRDWCCHLVRN
jgi:hypothetical protein